MSAQSTEPEPAAGQMLIDGDWRPGTDSSADLDPSTGETIGHVARGGKADVDRAVLAARRAFPAWSALPATGRARILHDAAEALAGEVQSWSELMAREMGKPLAEARAECTRVSAILRYFAGEAQRPFGEHFASDTGSTWLFTRREPLGVVGIITPWNFPAAIPAWKMAPALLFGNTLVVKLAGDAVLTGLRLVRALQDAGLPPGVLNVVLGAGDTVGHRLVEHPDVAAISFTGSTAVGRGIIALAASAGKPVQTEMGGHNPVIVCADANLGQALDAVALGAFASAGQKCTATRRVYVARPLYDDFVAGLVERAGRLKVGNALAPDTQLGPLAGASQLEGVLADVEIAGADGALRVGGRRLTDAEHADGCFMGAAVLTDMPPDSALATQEVFGPVVAVWGTADEAPVELANRTTYGLSAAIFTRDLNRARAFVEGVRAGIVHVNSQTAGAEVHVPFGGLAASSYGPHEQGRSAMAFYTQEKTVYLDPAAD